MKLEEYKEVLINIQRRDLMEMNTKVRIQASIGSLLICDTIITGHFYTKHADMTCNSWHNDLMSTHADNYEFIKAVLKLAQKSNIPVKINFSGPSGVGKCTFYANKSINKNTYCVDRFFNSWAEAWQRAVSAKGRLIDAYENNERV